VWVNLVEKVLKTICFVFFKKLLIILLELDAHFKRRR